MPVYVYRNLTTGDTFEVNQRITEPALTEHPETGDPVKRLIQPVGIAFKGSGFYVTDSRGSKNGGSSPSADTKATSDKSDASKSDTPKALPKAESGSSSSTKD